jgi:hypothetical protein
LPFGLSTAACLQAWLPLGCLVACKNRGESPLVFHSGRKTHLFPVIEKVFASKKACFSKLDTWVMHLVCLLVFRAATDASVASAAA